MNIFDVFEFDDKLQILDVGAAIIKKEGIYTDIPIYKKIIDMGLAQLTAFDGDKRHTEKFLEYYKPNQVEVFNHFLFDGEEHELFICKPDSGMTSLFKPKKEALDFFNGFSNIGEIQSVEKIKTKRLDDVPKLRNFDFLKMDVQGSELSILKNGENRLKSCLGIQLEVSYFSLYEGQPTFGDVDVYMRSIGYVPHRFLDLKHWSIAPTIFRGDFRTPGNQLLESDIIYIKNPLLMSSISDNQLHKFSILAHYCFQSVDLCVYILIEMEKRKLIEANAHNKYVENLKNFS